jgi:hypothetical protein
MKSVYLLSLLAGVCTAPAWIPFPIDRYLTVAFPAKPSVSSPASRSATKLGKANTPPFPTFLAQDETGAYLAVVVDASSPRDSLTSLGATQLLGQAKDKHVLSRTRFHTPAGDGVELVMQLSSPTTHTPVLVYNRILFAHQRVYTFTFTPNEALLDSVAHNAQRRRFFDSITVKP